MCAYILVFLLFYSISLYRPIHLVHRYTRCIHVKFKYPSFLCVLHKANVNNRIIRFKYTNKQKKRDSVDRCATVWRRNSVKRMSTTFFILSNILSFINYFFFLVCTYILFRLHNVHSLLYIWEISRKWIVCIGACTKIVNEVKSFSHLLFRSHNHKRIKVR